MAITDAQLLQWLSLYFYPFVRIAAMISIIPLFGMRTIPARVKILFALFITVAAAPMLVMPEPINPFSLQGLFVIIQQTFIGLAMGLVFVIVFQSFVIGGHMVAMGMGLAFAQMADPTSGVSAPIVSQFFTIMASLLFLVLNGHLVVIQTVVDSFQFLPIGVSFLDQSSLQFLVEFGGYMFMAGVLMALPAVTALLLINVSFGVVARAAPALNIFAVGFPVTLLAGLVMLTLTTPILLPHLQELVKQAVALIFRFTLTT
jgi:flagellar biosynthetic protein FliR